jgi:hypothetical protein
MNGDYSLTNNKLGLDRISPAHSINITNYLHFTHTHNLMTAKENDTFLHIRLFFFQLARGGIESAIYKKLIAPFMNDLPASSSDGFRRACAEHKYVFFGSDLLKMEHSLYLSCQLVPLPETSYKLPGAFVISKNSSYKGLINWR